MNHSVPRQDIALFFGILMAIMALGGTIAGKLPGRFGDVSTRAKNPGQYWSALIGYYVGAFAFLAYYLHETHAF
jgi:hypothetical protein